MPPGKGKPSARSLALQILVRVERAEAQAKPLLEVALNRSGMPPEERALATALVQGVLRERGRLDYVLGQVCRPPRQPWVRNILRLGVYLL